MNTKVTFKQRIRRVLSNVLHVNSLVSRWFCSHLMGDTHTLVHRICAGVVLMILGVFISKLTFNFPYACHVTDAVGYGVHAIGCTPLIEAISKR